MEHIIGFCLGWLIGTGICRLLIDKNPVGAADILVGVIGFIMK